MTESKLHIAIISENDELQQRIKKLFAPKQIHVLRENDPITLITNINKSKTDIVIIEDSVSSGNNTYSVQSVVSKITELSPHSQILILAQPKNIKSAVSSLESGAYQYAKKPVSDGELKTLIQTAMNDNNEKVTQSPLNKSDRFGEIIGRSPLMLKVYKQIKRAAKSDIPVLILGETGTGKDLTAQVIHRKSSRSDHPYVTVNLGSLPTDLVASELFGHEKGAFSGAIKQHQGVFERGENGTVFLDEIDSIDEKVRVSLLRLLDQKSFSRLGGTKTINSNVRLIAASNADLDEMVDEGEFREDLFYRLDVFRISMPPLRDRVEDIPLLVQEFVNIYSNVNKRKPLNISREYLEILQAYQWPGNIRELKSVIHRSVLMCDIRELKPKHLPPRFNKVEPLPGKVSFDIGTPLDEVERVMVLRALEASNNNKKDAAELLGISRRAIYNKLKKHDIS